MAAGSRPTLSEPEAQWEASLSEHPDLPDVAVPESPVERNPRRGDNAALLATMTLEDAVARIPDALKEKLQDRLKGNFREVIRYERKESTTPQNGPLELEEEPDIDESESESSD